MEELKTRPEPTAAEAFALLIETACEDFEIMHSMIRGDLQVVSRPTEGGANANREKAFRAPRAPARIQMALAKSFVFNARRANRVCTHNKDVLPLDRTDRTLFLKATDPLTAVRDVNEHGYDRDGESKPSMHEQEGGYLDETALVVFAPNKILMGPLNLYEIYLKVERMRKLAGFGALAAAKPKAMP